MPQEQMIFTKMMMTTMEWHLEKDHILIQNRAPPSKSKMFLKDSSSLVQQLKGLMIKSKINKKFQPILDLVHILYQWVLLIKIREIQTTYPFKVVITDSQIWRILKYQDQDLIKTRPWLSNYRISPGASREYLAQLRKDSFKLRYYKYQALVSTNLKDQLTSLIKRKISTLRDQVQCLFQAQKENQNSKNKSKEVLSNTIFKLTQLMNKWRRRLKLELETPY